MRYVLILVLVSLAGIRSGTATAADVIFQPLASTTNDRHADLQSLSVLLANGLFGTRKDCRARIVRDAGGQWHIVNIYDHARVDHLVVETWAFGISTIDGICPR